MNKLILMGFSIAVLTASAYATPPLAQTNQTKTAVSVSNQSLVNLNQADVATLAHSIRGIGMKRAEAIIKYRADNGNFKTVADLGRVSGLKSFVEKNLAALEAYFSVN